ncbi:MAG: NAD(P)H-dependent glycerol-3-phosphate dehydrogenase [Vulcanococcus sp.]|jgi:glycerol-3-phosphate dehydrogenase (NAD(P)+)
MSLCVSVIGLGAWGSTLASLLARQGHRIQGWSRSQGGAPRDALAGADLALVATSLQGAAQLAPQLAPLWPGQLPLISCSKGLDLQGCSTASQIWCREGPQIPLLVLSGPNLARELEQGLPAASVLASSDLALARHWQRQLSGDQLRLYANADPIGTEVVGALKNVMAIAAGICDGLALGANAKASLLCRGLAEMGVVIEALGGDGRSLYGLAGLGDLLATANSHLSRNYRYGLALAEGLSAEQAQARVGATVEGASTVKAVTSMARQRQWHLPICQQVLAVMEGRVAPPMAVQALMQRDLKDEQGQP